MCCHDNMKHCILLKFCTETLIIICKHSSKFFEDWLRNSVTVTSLLSWMGWFCISANSKMCCHGNINSPILLKFGTKIQRSISNKIQIFVKINSEMTSLLFWRTRSSQCTHPRKCCHGNSKGFTLKLLHFNKFLYIFKKIHQIWLNYFSPSLSYGQKPQGWSPTGQDRVKEN